MCVYMCVSVSVCQCVSVSVCQCVRGEKFYCNGKLHQCDLVDRDSVHTFRILSLKDVLGREK